jgi:hypothetical protein
VSFNTNINRQYNRQQFRQVDVQGLVLTLCIEETLHSIINGFNYNLTKSLKVGYTASSGNIKNYLNENNEPIDSFSI